MPIAKITGQGLAAMTLSVALLWSCIIAVGVMERRAAEERAKVLRDLKFLQRSIRPEPVSAPVPRRPYAPLSFAG
jgi:hypothetical protein